MGANGSSFPRNHVRESVHTKTPSPSQLVLDPPKHASVPLVGSMLRTFQREVGGALCNAERMKMGPSHRRAAYVQWPPTATRSKPTLRRHWQGRQTTRPLVTLHRSMSTRSAFRCF